MQKYDKHQKILNQFQIYINNAFKDEIRTFKRHVGVFQTSRKTTISVHQKGMWDLWGILKTRHGTMHLEFEVKTGQSKLSPSQKKWKDFLETFDVIHFVVTENNFEEIKKTLQDRILQGNYKHSTI